MRKTLSIILYVIAGFFVYADCNFAFVSKLGPPKFLLILGFMLPGVIAHCGGLALNRFQNWQKHTGIVLLSGAAVGAFLVFTFVCMFMTDDFKKMMPPGTLDFANDYISGGTFIVLTAVIGLLLLKRSPAPLSEKSSGE